MRSLALALLVTCAATPHALAAQGIPVRSEIEAGAALTPARTPAPDATAPMLPARHFSSRAPGGALMIGGAAAVIAGILVGGGGGTVLILGGVAAGAYGFYLYHR
ncbi:MAG: hypothetical protein WBC97_08580 [Gemmatimonadales bacterium]